MGSTAVVQGGSYLADVSDGGLAAWTLGCLTIAGGSSLILGLLTPGASALAGLGTVVIAMNWIPSSASGLLLGTVDAWFVMADAAALILLGPGAFSVDATLFGRREIILSDDARGR